MNSETALGFNTGEYEPSAGIEPIPAGDYQMMITWSSVKAAKSGNGRVWSLGYRVTEGEYVNRQVIRRLNLVHNNETAQRIAREELRAICDACGWNPDKLQDTSELHNIPMQVVITVKNRPDNGQLANEFGKHSPGRKTATMIAENRPPAPAPKAVPVPVAPQVPSPVQADDPDDDSNPFGGKTPF